MIREFAEEDAEACSRIVAECLDQQSSLPRDAQEYIKSRTTPQALIGRSRQVLLVTYTEGDMVQGLGALDGNEIRTMFTRIRAQGKSIGTAILAYLEKEAQRRGYEEVFLYSSLEATEFYKKNGYRYIQRDDKQKGNAVIENALMRKTLVPQD